MLLRIRRIRLFWNIFSDFVLASLTSFRDSQLHYLLVFLVGFVFFKNICSSFIQNKNLFDQFSYELQIIDNIFLKVRKCGCGEFLDVSWWWCGGLLHHCVGHRQRLLQWFVVVDASLLQLHQLRELSPVCGVPLQSLGMVDWVLPWSFFSNPEKRLTSWQVLWSNSVTFVVLAVDLAV